MCIAEQTVTVDNRFPYLEQLCQNYIVPAPRSAAPLYRISPEELSQERLAAEKLSLGPFSDGYLEMAALHRKLCDDLVDRDILAFHGAAVRLEGSGFLFTAPSGTGKSTHTYLWWLRFRDALTVINGDKPFLRFTSEDIHIHGAPFCGKEQWQANTSAPLRGIVVLRQGKKNKIQRLTPHDAYPLLYSETFRSPRPDRAIRTLELVERLCHVPVFLLDCTISDEAVTLCHSALTAALSEERT